MTIESRVLKHHEKPDTPAGLDCARVCSYTSRLRNEAMKVIDRFYSTYGTYKLDDESAAEIGLPPLGLNDKGETGTSRRPSERPFLQGMESLPYIMPRFLYSVLVTAVFVLGFRLMVWHHLPFLLPLVIAISSWKQLSYDARQIPAVVEN